MMMISVGFKRLNDNAFIPSKVHQTDSGFDLYASEDVIIKPGETAVVPTGIAVQLPAGYEAQVRPRSGITAKTKLRVQLGTIDNGYAGEIGVIVDNMSGDYLAKQSGYMSIEGEYKFIENGKTFPKAFTYKIRKGDRIAQLVIQPMPAVEAYEVEGELAETERGEGGFGSSGTTYRKFHEKRAKMNDDISRMIRRANR